LGLDPQSQLRPTGGYFDEQPEPFVENYCKRVPAGRGMHHGGIQGAVMFLASDARK